MRVSPTMKDSMGYRAPHHAWYGQARWRKIAKRQLQAHPLCTLCLNRNGKLTPACIVDHIEPHHGNERAFFFGALQSLCKPCHDVVKRQEETIGYSLDIGFDGLPLDPKHPTYGK